MGGNQSKITVDKTTDIIINSIISSTQQSISSNTVSQTVLIDNSLSQEKYLECLTTISRQNTNFLESAEKLCKILIETPSEIKLKTFFAVKEKSQQINNLTVELIDKITEDISAKQKQDNGMSISNSTKTLIKDSLRLNKETIIKALQELTSENVLVQSVVIKSGSANVISLEASIEIVKDILMANNNFVKSVSDITRSISTDNSQSNIFDPKNVLYLIFGITTAFVIIVFGFVFGLRIKKNTEIQRMNEYERAFGKDFQKYWDNYKRSSDRKFTTISIIFILFILGSLILLMTYLTR